jgi:hypothetical protein
MEKLDLSLWGPLAKLIGTWEGASGDDTAPGDDRGVEKNRFRELFIYKPFGPANNHEQTLFGLNYTRTAWRLGEDSPFHEQIGYWLWDAQAQQIMQSFMIPRGMTVLAGGTAHADTKNIKVSATLGSNVFGICSNPFLDREFKTVQYDSALTILDDSTFSYEENTQIQIKGQNTNFNHIDKNTLKKTK